MENINPTTTTIMDRLNKLTYVLMQLVNAEDTGDIMEIYMLATILFFQNIS